MGVDNVELSLMMSIGVPREQALPLLQLGLTPHDAAQAWQAEWLRSGGSCDDPGVGAGGTSAVGGSGGSSAVGGSGGGTGGGMIQPPNELVVGTKALALARGLARALALR